MASTFTQDPYTLPERELTLLERLRVLGALVLLFLVVGAIMVVRASLGPGVNLQVGDISPRDVTAPRSVTYTSEVLTDRARQAAENEVDIVYDAPDANVARQQVSLARQILDRISSIRGDAEMSEDARLEALLGLGEISLSPESAATILALTEEEWLSLELEVVRVLDLSMRMVIRDVDLAEARRRVPTQLSFDLPEAQAAVVLDIVTDLVTPNTLANEERTAEARRRAREAVQPISTTYQEGQVVVRAGDRVTELQLEALRHIGLMEPARDWIEDLAALGLMLVLGMVLYAYIVVHEPALGRDWRRLGLLGAAIVVAAIVGRVMIPGHVLLPYMYPAAALPMLVTSLISPGLGFLVCLVPFGFYVELADGVLLELGALGLLSGVVGVVVLGRIRHLKAFVWGSAAVLLVNVAVILTFRLPGGNYDPVGLASLMGAGIINAALSGSIAIVGYLLVSGFTGAVTTLQLIELSRPTQPLLRELMLRAPGTYHHSVMVANMAEQAAERVAANALLARLGAYYHDVGKMTRPYFFSENQEEVGNVHNRLDPRASAEIIIGHVAEGVSLARKHRLPPAVIRFISEHHGRTRQDYFYQEAVQRHGPENVDESQFRYPGPRPQTKETAIVMLADACEAATRAARPANAQELSRMVERIVDDRLLEGELDECPLTLHDIAAVKVSFVNVLQGVFHPRVQYPEGSLIEHRPENGCEAILEEAERSLSDGNGDHTPEGSEEPEPSPEAGPTSDQELRE
ncbi:MAG: HD family phosphohydrolase [Anaerolineae bacterium]